MQHRTFSYPSWSRQVWAVSLVVALAAAIFVLWGATAHAQQPGQRPDFKVTQAQFDGRNLHVEYINATGIGYPARRYEVGFQWYDASGAPVGTRHWLPVPSVERGGIAIFDTKYRTDLTYRRSDGRQYNRTLPEFILQRPNTAEELRIIVDDGDRIAEEDERNNIARLRIPLPDLQITGAKFRSPNQLELSYRNANPSSIPVPFRIGFTWAEESGTALNATRWINVLEPAAGATEIAVLSRTDASYLTAQGRQTGDRLDWYFERRPGTATRMKITIDDAGTVREANEQNNLVSVRPFLPDLVVRDAKFADGQLTFTYGNDGDGPIRDTASRVLIQWVGATGKPIGGPRWIGFAQMDPKQTFAVNADRFDVEYAIPGTNRTATQRLSTYVRERPADAAQLRITIDDERRILEADEENNVATVTPPPSPQPDFTITDATFTADALGFTVRNLGPGAAPPGQPVSLWFEWVDTGDARVGALAWVDARSAIAPGQFLRFTGAHARFTRERTGGDMESVTLAEFLAGAPDSATHLKVRADGPDAIHESDETNNTALLAKSISPMPDLAITDLALTADRATWELRNIGDPIPPPRPLTFVVEFQWLDQAGAPVGPSAGINSDIYFPTSTYVHNRASGYSGSASSDYILRRPTGAVALRVTEDSANVIREKDETNNVAEAALPPPPQPDLAFARVTVKVEAPSPKIEYIGENRGTVDVERVTLGLQWLDANGNATGPVHPPYVVFGRLRAGGTSTTWMLPFSDSGQSVSRALGRYLLLPPSDATHLRLTLDPENATSESDEANNAAIVERPASVPLSDLTITNARLAETDFALTYKNNGSVHAGYFMTLSTWFEWVDANGARVGDLVWHDGESLDPRYATHLDTATVVSSAARAKFPLREFLAAPPDSATHLKVSVDGPNTLLESNEANNVTVLPVPVRPKPNLQLIGIDALPNNLILVRMMNRGKGKVAGFRWELQWEDAKGASLGTPVREDGIALASGYSYNVSIDAKDTGGNLRFDAFFGKPPAGAARVRATVDPENAIPESDETNNQKTFDGVKLPEPPKQPDLAFTNVFLVPPKRERLVIGFENKGKVAAPEFSWRMTWVDAAGKRVGTPYEGVVPALKPNWRFGAGSDLNEFDPNGKPTSRGKWLRQSKPDGAVTLEIIIDPENRIAESDETNNRQTFDEWSPPKPAEPEKESKPDLVLRDATLADGKLKVTIVNTGKGPAERVMWQFTWLGEKGEALTTSDLEAAVGTLKPGASYPVELPYFNARPVGIFRFLQDMPDGAAALAIAVDPKNAIAESDEGNNTTRTVLPGADLALGAATVRGDALIIPVVNHGTTASVPTDMWLQWYGKGKWLPGSGAVDVPAVNGGATVEVKVPLSRSFGPDGKLLTDIPPTAERLRLFVDGLRKVPERNEQNNLLMVNRSVFPKAAEPEKPGKPDLVPEGLKVDPASPTDGAMLDFSAVVRNKGTGKAEASVAWFIVDFDRDDEPDVSPEPDDVKALAPNATQPVVWEDAVEAQAGTHAVEFCVDVEEAVDESNEDNNCVSRAFTVGSGPMAIGPFRSILGAILSGLATPIVAGERP